MNRLNLNRTFHKCLSLASHAIHVTFADAVLYAGCGALYGIVFGGFGAQVRNELTLLGVFSMGGTCALVGFGIGATVGAFGEVSKVRSVRQRQLESMMRTAVTLPEKPLSLRPAALQTGTTQNPLIVTAGKVPSRMTALGG